MDEDVPAKQSDAAPTLLQRAAKAVFSERYPSRNWDSAPEGAKLGCYDTANAVLRAIREPTEAMIGACDQLSVESLRHDPCRATVFWQAMIDASLAESR